MTGEVRVLVYHAAEDPSAIEQAYHQASHQLQGVPGLRGNELLRSVHDQSGFVVASSWESLEAFQAWEQGATHRDSTAPLRPFRDTRLPVPFAIYQVAAAY
ncbi:MULTISPECIES: antibiotic biosynthesis monooxygenase family protein [Actinoalloteichus]|uniref:Antibiotic biosynthesis monooxygenase n=1 Tax=Actinoalloteichus fjordicus TaxID=1612552 RepID=A0AAC9LCN3_9PSEU|nr:MULTISPECIES: antibiotic biosynthesis monooxygenase [Actinoalloteichus]APU14267.1 Antibiotic biosynthesis monooxygenase [Actinoalloteichus fjordicus]APU20237.1 Antibiotic biosynthesis monooxygenase [Actinoalloteichus sp. GBA129-24]